MNSKDKNKYPEERFVKTTMIGAISRIEKHFGKFWGHEKPQEERSERQLIVYDLFMKLREDILDLGNDQIDKLRQRANTLKESKKRK
jgi:hypothetical protein